MGNPINAGCPYQTEDGLNDRNRFPHGHLFIGEIENGIRYPFGVYTKAESDAKYAAKKTEDDLADLADVVETKAAQSDLDSLADSVATKAAQSDLTDLTAVVATKAAQSEVTEISADVLTKASQDDLNSLSAVVDTKASEAEAVAIRARLDALEYVGIDISTFVAVPNVCEFGSSNVIDLAWTTNKPATEQDIDGTPVTGSSKQFQNVTTAQTYTLTVTDGRSTDSKNVSIKFENQIYYGAADDLTNVTNLSRVLSDNPERTITVNAGAGKYIIYAIPARLGDVAFFVGGFEGGFEDAVEQVLTNASGYQEAYKVYRSTNAGLGETTIEVREV